MGFCDLPLADKVCGVGDAVDFASNPGKAIGNWMAKSAGELAATAADFAARAVDTTARINLDAGWFRDNYETILPIGLVVLVATFCAQLIRAAVKRDGQSLAQAFTGTAGGVLFAFCALTLTSIALDVVDALSDGLFHTAHLTLATAVRRIIQAGNLGHLTDLGWLLMVIVSVGAAMGAFLFWCVMMVRKIGILVLVTLAVFAGAGGGWEATRRWRRGWIEATATLVASKLLMTIVFLLGVSALGKTHSKDGLGALADVMSGIVIMVLVLLCPYATFKFVHWAASEGSDGEGLHRAGGAGAQLARQHAERAGRKAAAAAATAGTGGAAAAGGAGAEAAGAPQGPDTSGGGFPGDIAPGPDHGGQEEQGSSSPGQQSVKTNLDKAVQPPPTRPDQDTNGQLGGPPDASGPESSPPGTAGGGGGGWQSTPPITSPPPQGAPPAGSQTAETSDSGTGGTPPPSPAGP